MPDDTYILNTLKDLHAPKSYKKMVSFFNCFVWIMEIYRSI